MKNHNFFNVYCIFLVIVRHKILGQHFSHVTALYDHVTAGKYPYLRPEANLQTPTNVSVKFYLASLQDLDDNAGKFAVSGFFEIAWRDSNSTWDSSSFDHTDTIMVPDSKIWKPYFFHANPYKSVTIVSMSDSRIRLYQDGAAYWHPAVSFESSCDADVSFFPFDSQTCELWIIPWQQSVHEINLLLPKTTVDMTYYSVNAQWDYVTSNLYVKSSWNSLHISMTFKRHPTYFMLNVIFPIILLAVLNLFVFVLPVDSGERVGFAITLLLSIAVFMTIVADSLPSTSSPRLSSVGIFLCTNLILSTLIMICTIIGLVIYHREEKMPITPFWERLLRVSEICSKKQKIGHGNEDYIKKEELKNHETTWKDVGLALDKLFIFTFSVIMFISSFSFILDIVVGVN